jgi:hypothetical protein
MGARTRRNAIVGLFDAPPWRDWAVWNLLVWSAAAISTAVSPPENDPNAQLSLPMNILSTVLALATVGLGPAALRRWLRHLWGNRQRRRQEKLLDQPTEPRLQHPAPNLVGPRPPAAPPPPAPRLQQDPIPHIPEASVVRPSGPVDRRSGVPMLPPTVIARSTVLPPMPDVLSDAQRSYPYPIARIARILRGLQDPVLAYETILDLAETTTICIGATVATVCRAAGHVTPALVELYDAYSDKGVSQGHWLAVARDARTLPPELAAIVPGMEEGVRLRKKATGLPEQLRTLLEERNRWAHGSRPRGPVDAAERVETLLPVLATALAQVGFMSRTDWVLIEDSRLQRQTRRFVIGARRVMGDHPDFEVLRFNSSEALEDEVLYLRAPTASLALSPIIVVRHCPTCRQTEVFHSDRLAGGHVVLKAFGTGHELRDPTLVEELRSLTSRMAG